MFLNLSVSDAVGTSRGLVRVKLDFGQSQWSVEQDKDGAWQGVGFSTKGAFELKPWGVMWVWDQLPGQERHNTVILWHPPESESDSRCLGGQARIFDPKDSAFKEGGIGWSVDTTAPAALTASPSLTPVRSAMLELLNTIPETGLSSDDKEFQKITGFNTTLLKSQYWDVVKVKVKDKTTGVEKEIDNPNRDFTTCNAFLGGDGPAARQQAGQEPGREVRNLAEVGELAGPGRA